MVQEHPTTPNRGLRLNNHPGHNQKKQEESTVVPPVFFDCLRLKGQKKSALLKRINSNFSTVKTGGQTKKFGLH